MDISTDRTSSKLHVENVSFVDLLDTNEVKQRNIKFQLINRFSFWLKNNIRVVILLLAAFIIILGSAGFDKQYNDKIETSNVADGRIDRVIFIFYSVLQLFVLVGKIEPGLGWQLTTAYALAPIVTGYTGFATLAKIFHDKLSQFRVKISRNHVIIVGLGDRGLQLVKDFIAKGDKVVVIEIDENNEHKDLAESLGAIMIYGNSTEGNTLMKARVYNASYVIITTTRDRTNLKTAIQIHAIVLEKRGLKSSQSKISHSIHCKVHLVNTGFLGLMQNHEIFADTSDYFELNFFNADVNASRILFFDNPIDTLGDTKSDDASPLHILIHGFNDTGMGVALQAAKLGHFANGKKLRLTFLDDNPVEKERQLLIQYPQFENIVDFKFFKIFPELSFNENIVKIDDVYEFPLSAIIICKDTDENGLKDSLVFSRYIRKNDNKAKIPIFVHMHDNLGLSAFYNYEAVDSDAQLIYSFGNIERVCTRELVITEKLDILAETIHNNWRKSDSDPTWGELPDYLQDANRQQADHILVKLRTIGTKVEKAKNGKARKSFSFSDEEIEMLARMEHLRWNAERYLNGWRFGKTRDRTKKLTPYLIPYDELTDKIKENDRETIRIIPKLLSLLDFEIIRVNTN